MPNIEVPWIEYENLIPLTTIDKACKLIKKNKLIKKPVQKILKLKLFIKIKIINNPNKLAEAPNDLRDDDKKNNIKMFEITSSPPSIFNFKFSIIFLTKKILKKKKIAKNTNRNGDAKPRLAV